MLGNSFESTKDRFKDLENSELLSKKQKLVIRWLFNHKSEVKRTEYITYYVSNYVGLIMWFNVLQVSYDILMWEFYMFYNNTHICCINHPPVAVRNNIYTCFNSFGEIEEILLT